MTRDQASELFHVIRPMQSSDAIEYMVRWDEERRKAALASPIPKGLLDEVLKTHGHDPEELEKMQRIIVGCECGRHEKRESFKDRAIRQCEEGIRAVQNHCV